MRVVASSSEAEMVACFLATELASERFGAGIRDALRSAGLPETLVTAADLGDEVSNRARRELLGVTRGYGRNTGVFDADFPVDVGWVRAVLTPPELAGVRYIEYSYWNELSGGTRLPADAAERIRRGVRAFGVSNHRFVDAARAFARGRRFPPVILAGPRPDALVCLEGNLRLTAYALAGFPTDVECFATIDETLAAWAK